MKVLKSGKENASWGKEFNCKGSGTGKTAGCGALLLVSPRDVKSESNYDYGHASYWFVCPECGAKTYVSWNAFSKD